MRNRFFYLGLPMILIVGLVLFAEGMSRKPDFSISLTQTVLSPLPLSIVNKSIHEVTNWPTWFDHTVSATLLDGAGKPLPLSEQRLKKGSTARLVINPSPGSKHTVGIQLFVIDYEPGRFLRLGLTPNSSIKVTRYFSAMEWFIETVASGGSNSPEASGNQIKLYFRAKPAHWLTKILGVFSPQYALSDYSYLNIQKLAALSDPQTAFSQEVAP